MLDMDSSNSFTLGFPLFLFLPPPVESSPEFHQKCFLYIHEFDPHPKSRITLFFFFFEREERGVFFFPNHYPGNLIHTEYNGEERGRLDRGLEEIMKFVHIQASWKVPPALSTAPSFLCRLPSPAFPPTPPSTSQKEHKAYCSGRGRVGNTQRWSGSNFCPSVESSRNKWFQFSIWPRGPGTNFLITNETADSDSTTAVAIDKACWQDNPGAHALVYSKGYTSTTWIITLWETSSGEPQTLFSPPVTYMQPRVPANFLVGH